MKPDFAQEVRILTLVFSVVDVVAFPGRKNTVVM
jgi:hypothetical protein